MILITTSIKETCVSRKKEKVSPTASVSVLPDRVIRIKLAADGLVRTFTALAVMEGAFTRIEGLPLYQSSRGGW